MDAVGSRTLREILEYRADTDPEKLFVLFDDIDGGITSHSYADFDKNVNRTAHMLQSLGVGSGDKVNLHLSNCLEFLLLWFAAAKIGALIMPTNVAATAETIRDGWLWSGDNARQDHDGYFHFVDRAKDMIKRAGENIAASEVEAVILTHPQVFDCAVIGVPDPIRDESIVAVVVTVEGESIQDDAIIAWCRERLASFRVPERVEFRRALPRTSVGKIQKHLLRADSNGERLK